MIQPIPMLSALLLTGLMAASSVVAAEPLAREGRRAPVRHLPPQAPEPAPTPLDMRQGALETVRIRLVSVEPMDGSRVLALIEVTPRVLRMDSFEIVGDLDGDIMARHVIGPMGKAVVGIEIKRDGLVHAACVVVERMPVDAAPVPAADACFRIVAP